MTLCTTARLALREFDADDAPFLLRLLNDPTFIAHIADKNIRTVDGAREYWETMLHPSYALHGFGLWAVVRTDTGDAIGMCGLVKRDWLEDVDLGYALLAESAGRGYGREAARATLDIATTRFGLTRLAAIVSADNARSIRLLEDLGFAYARPVRTPTDEAEIPMYVWQAPA